MCDRQPHCTHSIRDFPPTWVEPQTHSTLPEMHVPAVNTWLKEGRAEWPGEVDRDTKTSAGADGHVEVDVVTAATTAFLEK